MPGLFLQKGLGMAWWTHILLLGSEPERKAYFYEENVFVGLYHSVRKIVRRRIIDILYVVLSIFTYVYLILSILTFFFHRHLPDSFLFIVETLGDPYLGALGVYIVVKEIARRRGLLPHRSRGEMFATAWLVFFLAASATIFLSAEYVLDEAYKIIVTNTFASFVIRISSILRWL